MKKELELYLHIPFCVRKCAYCDFLSNAAEDKTIKRYVNALIREIESCRRAFQEYTVATVFMGGGTPSILAGTETVRIFRALYENFEFAKEPEITIEVNPGTVTREKLELWKNAGINRLSIGLQSADNRELKLLGRIHTFEDFLETYTKAREAGFTNINVDLISAIPGQVAADWEQTLRKTAQLDPEHISAYSLMIEEGTLFYDWYVKGGHREGKKEIPPLPSEEEDRRIYKKTKEILKEYGYVRYEISNYAKEGYACRHNLGYWERKEYLGLGLGAASLINEQRFANTESLSEYLNAFEKRKVSYSSVRVGRETLRIQEQMEEFMFLGLRKMEGVSRSEFVRKFQKELEQVYGVQIKELKERGLLEEKKDFLSLTEFGIDVSNYVFEQFLDP